MKTRYKKAVITDLVGVSSRADQFTFAAFDSRVEIFTGELLNVTNAVGEWDWYSAQADFVATRPNWRQLCYVLYPSDLRLTYTN